MTQKLWNLWDNPPRQYKSSILFHPSEEVNQITHYFHDTRKIFDTAHTIREDKYNEYTSGDEKKNKEGTTLEKNRKNYLPPYESIIQQVIKNHQMSK